MDHIRRLYSIGQKVREAVIGQFPGGGGEEKLSIGADGYHTRRIDRFAEYIVLSEIERRGYHWNLISEEAGTIDNGSDITLILDPIDGTHNAITRIPFYSTSLALMDQSNGKITDSIVINIPTGNSFSAVSGKGALADGQRTFTKKIDMDHAVISSYIGPESEGWVEHMIFWPSRTRYFGCVSLEICLVATGSLDMFVMFGRIPRISDVAAASLILKEAGGEVFLLKKNNSLGTFRTDFNRKDIKAFFAVGDPSSIGELLETSNIPYKMEANPI